MLTIALITAGILLGQPAVPDDQDIQLLKEHIQEQQQEAEVDDIHRHEPEQPAVAMSVDWDRLAQCESQGQWDYGPHSDWGSGLYHGGLQFDPGTWATFAPDGYPEVAYQATREQQILVAELVLDAQGLRAWPACTKELGWR